MKVDSFIQEKIAKAVLAAQEEREPSGRLSAGRLGHPLQWQMLHYYKVKPAKIEEYTLRKFQRGIDVENRIVEWVAPTQAQVPVTYRGVAGIADMVLDCPVEVKSVTNMAFKYLQKEGAKRGHKLQAELYAKALGFKEYMVAYVASDDYRVLCLPYEVGEEVDKVIDEYEKQVKSGIVPTFKAEEKWQSDKKYSAYPEWTKLDEQEIAEKLAKLGITVPSALPLLDLVN